MRGVAIRAGIAAGLVIAAFAIAVAALNATVFSASGFVSTYLEALSRQDAATALALAGPPQTTSRRTDLLVDAAITPPKVTAIREETGDSSTRVTVDFAIGDRHGTSVFETVRSGVRFGFFSVWSFAQSPFATVELTILHGPDFRANGLELRAPAQDRATRYLAFTPTVLRLEHDSDLLIAQPKSLLIADATAPLLMELDVRANEKFVKLVQAKVDEFLADCAAQHVLMPAGCPFGQQIADRIASPPNWSIAQSPRIRLDPTSVPGEWVVPPAAGTAQLQVEIKSIFDGDVSALDEKVDFEVSFTVTFVSADTVVITPRSDPSRAAW